MRDFDLAELDDGIFTLGDAVGPRRRNRRHDVLKVETLLTNAGDHDLQDGRICGSPDRRGDPRLPGEARA
jgi:hypothetical protein